MTLVVGFSAGGSTDAIARALAEGLSPQLGKPVVVENMAGSGGSLAISKVAQAIPDGHTLLLAGAEVALSNSGRKDLSLVSSVAIVPIIAVIKPGTSRADLLKRERVKVYAAGIYPSLFARRLGLGNVSFVDYKGSGPALQDLMAGELDVVVLPYSSVKQQMETGRLIGLGVSTATGMESLSRTPLLPDLPPALRAPFVGLFAPFGTPTAIVEQLNAVVAKSLGTQVMRSRLTAMGVVPNASSVEAFTRSVQQLHAIIPDKCLSKETCLADAQCPRPCPEK